MQVGFEISHDSDERIRGTDVVYAKSRGTLLTTTDREVGAGLIAKHRNVEVPDGLLDGARPAAYDQAGADDPGRDLVLGTGKQSRHHHRLPEERAHSRR